MTDTYNAEQKTAAALLARSGKDLWLCGHPFTGRCEHARAMEDAARNLLATLGPEPTPPGPTRKTTTTEKEPPQ